nr:hypothetical protein [Tanacetum cinerariifolium]
MYPLSGMEVYTLGERIRMFKRRKLFYAINQVLSMHEGPIHEFTISMELDAYCDKIDHGIHAYHVQKSDVLSVLVLVIKSSPNLEKLKIDYRKLGFFTECGLFTHDDICSFSLKDYADIWLEHLNELHIRSFRNKGNELNFVKLILAKSPMLKNVRIYHELTSNELMQISKVLYSFSRASSVVDINV